MSLVRCTLPGWILLLASSVGCQSMIQSSDTTVGQHVDVIPVQIRPAHGAVKGVEIPHEPNMRLQDVIEKSRPKFRNREAYIVRTSPKTGKDHKLDASFGSNRRISLETDYAIQPGDRVVISQNTQSSFDRVMSDFLGRD